MCVQGARWVQNEVVKKHADSNLKTYVVWAPMLPGDARDKWPEHLISTDRARHFWDGERVVGKWLTANMKDCPSLGKIAWDAYYLLSKDAKWGESLDGVVACGTPVIKKAEELSQEVDALLKGD